MILSGKTKDYDFRINMEILAMDTQYVNPPIGGSLNKSAFMVQYCLGNLGYYKIGWIQEAYTIIRVCFEKYQKRKHRKYHTKPVLIVLVLILLRNQFLKHVLNIVFNRESIA